MKTPKILRILNKGAIAGLAVAFLSYVFPLVPCTKSPVIAEPVYKFSMCKLPNPFGEQIVGVSSKFYGLFTDSSAGLILQFLIPALIFTLIFLFFRKKAGNVLDLTNK